MRANASRPAPTWQWAPAPSLSVETAAALLVEKGPGSLNMTEIAGRAGVAASSLYRRWGEVGSLLLEVAVGQLSREHPLPDTGSLDGDLRAWAQRWLQG